MRQRDLSRRRFLESAGATAAYTLVPGALRASRGSDQAVATATSAPGAWAEADAIVARIVPPVFPARDFDVTRSGAIGDGATLCTTAFRQAVAECHAAGGGRVVVPAGRFLTGAIHLRSGVNLHVSEGATLRPQQRRLQPGIVSRRADRGLHVRHRRRLHRAQVGPQRRWRRVDVPVENVVIRDCVMKDGHGGAVIGSEIPGGARYIFAERCRMDSERLDRALPIKTNSLRGGVVEHVYMRDVTVGQVAEAVVSPCAARTRSDRRCRQGATLPSRRPDFPRRSGIGFAPLTRVSISGITSRAQARAGDGLSEARPGSGLARRTRRA